MGLIAVLAIKASSSVKVKRMQTPGTEAIRTQIQPLKPGNILKRAYGQPSEQLFHKRWPFSNPNRAENNMNTLKVKRHRNSDTKTGNREPQTNYRLGTVSNDLLGFKTFCTAPTSPSVSEVVQKI